MKYLVKFFVVTFFFLICTHTFAEQKIVVLDLTYVLNQSTAGNGAQKFLKKTFDDNIKKFSIKRWDNHLNINLKAPALLIQQFAKVVSKNTRANVINMVDQRVFKITPYFFDIETN